MIGQGNVGERRKYTYVSRLSDLDLHEYVPYFLWLFSMMFKLLEFKFLQPLIPFFEGGTDITHPQTLSKIEKSITPCKIYDFDFTKLDADDR